MRRHVALGLFATTALATAPATQAWAQAVRDLPFGELTFNANAVCMDDIYTSGGLLNRISDVQVRPADTLYDASVAIEADRGWRLALWGKNLTDEEVINNTFGLGALGNLRIYQPPRT